ncbi:hypothetical protein [Paraburkholderia lycopersici]|uniref:hypothetical protein n=1 Tax=Paraburkholderia lycopersici TaxID=416944 RepID=UPI0015A3355E|nr:hypothetical protein [Paraburkholderia lycopersici]
MKAVRKLLKPPDIADGADSPRRAWLFRGRDTIFPLVCKNHHDGAGEDAHTAGAASPDPVSKQGVVKTGMSVA